VDKADAMLALTRSLDRRDACPTLEPLPGARVPTFRAGDAEIAAQVASAEGDGKDGDEFEFIGDLDLGGEEAGFGTGMTVAAFAIETIHPAVMGAQVTVRQRSLRWLGASEREGGAGGGLSRCNRSSRRKEALINS
jgi:hypothetical protein